MNRAEDNIDESALDYYQREESSKSNERIYSRSSQGGPSQGATQDDFQLEGSGSDQIQVGVMKVGEELYDNIDESSVDYYPREESSKVIKGYTVVLPKEDHFKEQLKKKPAGRRRS